jgi:hypothetical protein
MRVDGGRKSEKEFVRVSGMYGESEDQSGASTVCSKGITVCVVYGVVAIPGADGYEYRAEVDG